MVCEKIRSRYSSEWPYLFYYERGESISSFSVGYAEDFSVDEMSLEVWDSA